MGGQGGEPARPWEAAGRPPADVADELWSAEDIRRLVVADGRLGRPTCLEQVRCVEPIVLDDLVQPGRVELVRCHLRSVSLRRARIGSLVIDGSTIGTPFARDVVLDATWARVAHGVQVTRSSVAGPIDLRGITCGADFEIDGARLRFTRVAVKMAAARITGSVTITRSVLMSGIGLDNARVGGLELVGSLIGPDQGWAVDLTTARSPGTLIIEGGCDIRGTVALVGARWDGQIAVRGASEVGPVGAGGDNEGLLADGLTTGNDLIVRDEDTVIRHGLRLHSAHIGGQLVVRAGARIGSDANGNSLVADSARIDQDLVVGGAVTTRTGALATTLQGGIQMPSAVIGGSVKLVPGLSVRRNGFGNSVFAERMTVTGDVRFERKHTVGERDTKVPPRSIDLDGAIRLGDATVGGSLILRDGVHVQPVHPADRPPDPDGPAPTCLDAPGLQVTRDLLIEGSTLGLHGSVVLEGATVGGQLSVGREDETAPFCRPPVCATAPGPCSVLDLRGASLGTLRLEGPTGADRIDLRSSRIDQLADSPAAWGLVRVAWSEAAWARVRDPRQRGDDTRTEEEAGRPPLEAHPKARHWRRSPGRADVVLSDLGVARLPDNDLFPRHARHAWLRRTIDPHTRTVTPAGEAAYRSVARAVADGGDDKASLDVLAEMKRRHRKLPSRLLMASIGQGYRPWMAVVWLVVLVGVTALFADAAEEGGPLLDTAEVGCEHQRCFEPVVFAIDVVVPVLDLGEASEWQATTQGKTWRGANWLHWYLAAARTLGAVLTALFLIGATGRILDRRGGP